MRPLFAASALPLLFSLCAGACEPSPVSDLASIDAVEPAVVEPGDVIEIGGEGFVEGPATVVLEGMFDPVGLVEAKRRRVALEGTATSGRLLRIPVGETTMASLASEPTVFEGAVSVSFPAARLDGATRIGATIEQVEIELRPGGGGVATAARRARESREVLKALGMVAEAAVGLSEIVVTEVALGGAADRHGIAPGDRILSIDGIAVTALNDLAGLDLAEAHAFELVTPGGAVRSARVEAASADPMETDELAAMTLAALFLGVFFAFAWPRTKSFEERAVPGSKMLARVVGIAAASFPILLLPAVAIMKQADLGATFTLMAVYTVSSAIASFWGEAPSRLALLPARILVVPILLVVAGAFGSSFGLGHVVSSQAFGPWAWHAWSNPFAALAVLAAVSLVWQPVREGDGASPLAVVASWAAAVSGSMVIVAWTLGGWLVPAVDPAFASSGTLAMLAGTAVFAAKTWLVLLGARWFARAGSLERRAARSRARGPLFRAALLVVCSCAAMIWSWADLPADLAAAGRILSGGFSIALSTAFVTSLIARFVARHRGVETTGVFFAK